MIKYKEYPEENLKDIAEEVKKLKHFVWKYKKEEVEVLNEKFPIQVIDTNNLEWVENKDYDWVILMFPGITPQLPYQFWWIVVDEKWKMEWLEHTEDLAMYFYKNWKRVVEFWYPEKWEFNFENYSKTILEYLKRNNISKNKPISILWLSMWGKVALLTAAILEKNGYKVDELDLYAPSLDVNSLNNSDLLKKLPVTVPAVFWKYVIWPMLHFLVWKSGQLKFDFSKLFNNPKEVIKVKRDWWVEIPYSDLSKLAKAVWNYNVTYQQIKSRLKFIFKELNKFNDLLAELKNIKKVKLIVTDFPKDNISDWTIDNIAVMEQVKQLFPESDIDIIELEWLPHGQFPQSNKLHEKIFNENNIK